MLCPAGAVYASDNGANGAVEVSGDASQELYSVTPESDFLWRGDDTIVKYWGSDETVVIPDKAKLLKMEHLRTTRHSNQ